MSTTNTRYTVMRFVTVGGAHVAVTTTRDGNGDYAWQCGGCDQGARVAAVATGRRDANTHARLCRSIPKDTPDQQ